MCDFADSDAARQLLVGRVLTVERVAQHVIFVGTPGKRALAVHVLSDAAVERALVARPPGVRKLRGRERDWRIRVGRFRVLYSIDDASRKIVVHRVTDRKDVYRGL